MNLDRATITLLIAIIGGLFPVLTYLEHSIVLGIVGFFCMVLLWWLHREWVDEASDAQDISDHQWYAQQASRITGRNMMKDDQ